MPLRVSGSAIVPSFNPHVHSSSAARQNRNGRTQTTAVDLLERICAETFLSPHGTLAAHIGSEPPPLPRETNCEIVLLRGRQGNVSDHVFLERQVVLNEPGSVLPLQLHLSVVQNGVSLESRGVAIPHRRGAGHVSS